MSDLTMFQAELYFMKWISGLPSCQVLQGRFSWRMEARCLSALMIFWIAEDFLWFAFNPDFGLVRFSQASPSVTFV
jgi:hypothetical protein